MPDKRPYCGIVALSSVTGKTVTDLEYNINMNRRAPKGSKIVGMQVKELLNELTDSGFEYEINHINGKTRLTDYKTNGQTQLLVLDRFKNDNPHMIVLNNDMFVDSDNTKPTHRAVYKHSLRPILAAITIKTNGVPVSTLNEMKNEQP